MPEVVGISLDHLPTVCNGLIAPHQEGSANIGKLPMTINKDIVFKLVASAALNGMSAFLDALKGFFIKGNRNQCRRNTSLPS